jgi:DNA-binding CsgD family transcriptional regulator
MLTDDRLSRLIADIYDAALEPALWSVVLEKARDFVGGSAATIFAKDASRKSGNVYYQDGVDPHYTQLYFQEYVKLDPLTTGHVFAELEEPIATADIMPYDQFLDTRVYWEWVRPQGLVDFISAVLDKSATGAAMFGVFRHERNGRVDDETRQRMRVIVPHIRRAVMIGRVLDHKTSEVATFADTLDGLSAGMFLVDAGGRLVHANASGHAMMAQGGPVRTSAGKLLAGRASGVPQLDEAFGLAGDGEAALGSKGIALRLHAHEGERYSAHVLPLTSSARRRADAGSAAAALFVHKVAVDAPTAPEIIAKTYKLTPSELLVLLTIVRFGGVPETAEELGISESTVKTHLHRLFAKTETRRQADLVKLVAGFSNPLVN